MLNPEDYSWVKKTFKGLDFFDHCSDDDILSLAESMEEMNCEPGQLILRQGEFSDRLYLIRSGTVDILKRAGSDSKKVAELGEGEYFGEISLMTPSSAIATVKAQTGCVILTMTGEVVESVLSHKPNDLQEVRKKIEERKKAFENPKN